MNTIKQEYQKLFPPMVNPWKPVEIGFTGFKVIKKENHSCIYTNRVSKWCFEDDFNQIKTY
jgi:hypothetical protein